MNRKYPITDIKQLYGKAAGRCALPECRISLILENTGQDTSKQIGKIAHIVGHSPEGPRGDSNFPKEKLDKYDNWILLCPTCHDIVDAQENTYTIEFLKTLKSDHEKWVDESLEAEIDSFGFAELDVAIKGISQAVVKSHSGFTVVTPAEKISKNNLTDSTQYHLTIGLMRSKEIEKYLMEMDKINPGFADRITQGFKDKYKELKQEGLSGDSLFGELLDFSSNGSNEFKIKAAGLSLLSHLFEICEVFEK